MDFLLLVFIYLVLFAVAISCYMAADSPIFTRGPVGCLRSSISRGWLQIMQCVPITLRRKYNRTYHHVFFERNGVFQAIYAFLLIAAHLVLLIDGMPYLYTIEPHINHMVLPFVLFLVNAVLFLVCSKMDPGEINASNLKRYLQIYSPDGVLYSCDNQCRTCLLTKPARSKHCAVYDKCIFKFDHYCAWTNNCVGGLNHRYFMLFLISLCVMCFDGTYLTLKALGSITQVYNLLAIRYLDSNGLIQPMNLRVLIQTLFLQFPRLVFLAASLIVILMFLLAFTGYHIYLVATNQTTNERYKKHYLKKSQSITNISNPYNRGIFSNVFEEVFPLRRESKRLAFKSR